MSEPDDWGAQPAADDWQSVGKGAAPVPQAFVDRVERGAAIARAAGNAKPDKEQGIVAADFDQLVEAGIISDPYTGRPGAVHGSPLLSDKPSAWEQITHALSSDIGRLIEGMKTLPQRAFEESERMRTEGDFDPGTMIEGALFGVGGHGQFLPGGAKFARPHATGAQEIGALPHDTDFKAAAEVSGAQESKLRELWNEKGIHPSEAAHDAQGDAFLKHDLASRDRYLEDQVMKWASGMAGNADMAALPEAVQRLGRPIESESTFYRGEWPGRPEFGNESGAISVSDRPGGNSFGLIRNEWALEEEGGKIPLSEIIVPTGTKVLEVHKFGGPNAGEMETMLPAGRYKLVGTREEPYKVGQQTIPQEIKTYRFEPSAEGQAHSLGAAATDMPPADVPFSKQPAPPPGRIAAAVQATTDKLLDIGGDIQMKVAPMATGTTESMAAAKDFANVMRRNRWEWSRVDDDIAKRFTPEQRTRMWNAADEESVLLQEGKASEHMGLATLTPEEKLTVDALQARAQNAWLRAHDAGLVEGEGLPAYTPRMVINTANAVAEDRALPLNSIGNNLKTTSGNLKQRKYTTAEETEAAAKAKYGDQAELARDIRTLPLATAKLEDAIAGRSLINNIRDVGKSTGDETVAEGAIPAGSDHKWFTLDHPAFRTWRPKFKDGEVVKDADGNVIHEQVPIYVRDDFEGPLRSVLNTKSGPLYTAAMELKGKTMSLIMYSPAIHNMVELGRAFPAMPTRIFKAYFDGNRAKNDIPLMREAIDNGLVPIGKRFFKQDIDAVMETPDLTPGRSWTAQVLAAVPGLFDEAAGTAVKRAVDKAGDFWHNTLLWDRIADLQMGIYVNMRGDLMRKGVDPQTSSRVAAHLANRYAGALPQEAMSAAARKTANLMLFSRSFTMGNLGVMKDMLTGMPKDVLAQIERDMGQVNPEAAGYAKSLARRKAIATVALDIGLMYVGNSVLQSAFNVMLGDHTLDQELHGYVKRMREVMNEATAHPLSMLQPFDIAEKLSATSENEPGRKDRVKIGYQKDGTAIYARNPVGKIGEEFVGYLASPLDMLRRKQGTIARPTLQVLSNDKGFGRKVYDPNADTPAKYAGNIWAIVEHFAKAQGPEGQINAFADLVKGDGDPKTNAPQTAGPFAGVTFSKGAPGGPAVGELYKAREVHDYQVNLALPDIRKQIIRGDVAGATARMTELGIPGGLQRFYIRTSQNPATRLSPRAIKDFYQYATPQQRERMERARSAPNAMTGPDF